MICIKWQGTKSAHSCWAIMAHTKQSRSDTDLKFQVKVLSTFHVVATSLESGPEKGQGWLSVGSARLSGPPTPSKAPGRNGNTVKAFKDFDLKAKAILWPSLSNMCHIRLKAQGARVNLISHQAFLKSFCKSQFPHKSANLFSVSVTIKDTLTDSC